MNNSAIVGINWGDEGKGRMVDLLCADYDVVVRYQGGGNAGHTVVNQYGETALHLLPSGIFHEGVVNILGNNVALDMESLCKEIAQLREKGVKITPDNLKISERCSLLMPWHKDQDELEEIRLKDKKYGSTKQGIAYFYGDKYQKKTILAGELFFEDELDEHLSELLEYKNLLMEGVYGKAPYTLSQLEVWCKEYGEQLKPFICDTSAYLREANFRKRILFEAQLGALRDVDLGISPYTTSSNTLAAYAPVGAGCPGTKINEVIGVIKAYATCVGEGPFVCEMQGAEADRLRELGHEYGAKTGRPRRVGALDLVASAYGVNMQGATKLALTKLDVLSSYEQIPVCTAYKIDDELSRDFPFPAYLDEAEAVIEYLPGWNCDITGIRKWSDLPKAAKDYVQFIEDYVRCPIAYISVGPQREAIIER